MLKQCIQYVYVYVLANSLPATGDIGQKDSLHLCGGYFEVLNQSLDNEENQQRAASALYSYYLLGLPRSVLGCVRIPFSAC